VVFKNTSWLFVERQTEASAAEAIQGAALALERVHDVQRRHGLAAGVLGVGDRVADDVLEEHLEHAAGLLVDEAADALDAAAACEPADGGLRDSLQFRGRARLSFQLAYSRHSIQAGAYAQQQPEASPQDAHEAKSGLQ